MYTIYALKNRANKKTYIGQTKNLEQRLYFHENRIFKDSYTARFNGKWEVIYTEEVASRAEALVREKQLKSHQGREFIKQFIPR